MSTGVLSTATATDSRSPQLLVGTSTLLRFALRLDRRRLLIWVLSVGLITVYAAVALGIVYPTAADRLARAAVMENPAGVLLSGPGYGLADYTLGAMVANELSFSVIVAVAIMSIQLVVRHTRAQEEGGQAELVRAGAVGRRAALTAALGVAALADAAVVLVVTIGLVGSGLALVDSFALAFGMGLTGLLFGAVAAVTAQLTEHARAASGLALAVLAVAAVIRGVGDILETGGSWLSWLSPIAWAQQTRAFVDLRWEPLLLTVALTGLLVVGAFRLVGGRDVGAGLLPPRRGPADASGQLSGPVGLTLRLQRAAVPAWAVGLLLLGLVFGSLADAVADMVTGNAQLAAVLAASGADVTDSFFAISAVYVALGAGSFAVASVLRLRGEETAGRSEVLLATALDRRRYLGGTLTVTLAASLLLLLVGGFGTGRAAAAVRDDPSLVGEQLVAQLVHVPAVLVFAGVAVVLVGWAPRLAPLAWVVVGWALFAGFFGALLSLPEWSLDLSPLGWVPQVPAEPLAVAPLVGLTLVAVVLVALGLIGFRRRDVPQ
jgi:ABC-2 type transport system permease protein